MTEEEVLAIAVGIIFAFLGVVLILKYKKLSSIKYFRILIFFVFAPKIIKILVGSTIMKHGCLPENYLPYYGSILIQNPIGNQQNF